MNKTLTIQEAVTLIQNTKGKIFSVDFIKKDGGLRHLNGRLNVIKHLSGGVSTTAHKSNLITCYDMQSGGYRCINSDTLKAVKFGGVEYRVEG